MRQRNRQFLESVLSGRARVNTCCYCPVTSRSQHKRSLNENPAISFFCEIIVTYAIGLCSEIYTKMHIYYEGRQASKFLWDQISCFYEFSHLQFHSFTNIQSHHLTVSAANKPVDFTHYISAVGFKPNKIMASIIQLRVFYVLIVTNLTQ